MRLSDLLEAPIADITVHDYTSSDHRAVGRTNFTPSDRKLIRSERGREKMIRAFEKTPFVFKIHFVETDHFDGEDQKENISADGWSRAYRAGIHTDYSHDNGEIMGERGVITVVLMANLSDLSNKIPVTGWVLAHKVGHAFQDHMHNTGWEKGPLLDLIQRTNSVIAKISGSAKSTTNFDPSMGTSNYLTMRSAREGNLKNPFEIFPELLAQYLVNGKVTLQGGVDPRIEPLLNKLYEKLLGQLVGKVVVEI